MLNLTELIGFGAGGDTRSSISYITSASNESNLTTFTFSSVSFGAATDRSLVIIGVSGRQGNNRQVSAVTIDGISATLITRCDADNACTGIYAASVTSTSGDVVVTFSGGMDAAAIGVWAAYNLKSTTAFAAFSDRATTGATSLPGDVNTPATGIVVSVGSINASTLRTVTWTGVTERYEGAFATTRTYTGGDFTTTVAETPRSIYYTASGSTNNIAISSASWE